MGYVDPKVAATSMLAELGLGSLGELGTLVPIALGLVSMHDKESFGELKAELRTWAKRDPIDALIATVIGGGLAFYYAEHKTNPNCSTPWDGILYMSTALSVGYDNLFPTTPAGHALATFAQTFGPALANAALEPPAAEAEASAARAEAAAAEDAAVNRAILARLEDIVRLLEPGKQPDAP
jgi:voltage-gated potassium channel